MPQCSCGVFFSTTTFSSEKSINDFCPACKRNSTPQSYTNSYEWDCENVSNIMFENNNSNNNE